MRCDRFDRQTLIKSFKSIFLDFFVFVLCPYICVFVGDDRKISFGSAVSSPRGEVARSGYAVTPDSASDPVWFRGLLLLYLH